MSHTGYGIMEASGTSGMPCARWMEFSYEERLVAGVSCMR